MQDKINSEQHPVWNILKKEKYIEKFYPKAEEMYDFIKRLYNTAGNVTKDGNTVPAMKLFFDMWNQYETETFFILSEIVNNKKKGYVAEGVNENNIYGLYKHIMKHTPNAIDKINTLDEAKQIIKMITGNIYINGKVYELLELDRNFKRNIEENIDKMKGNDINRLDVYTTNDDASVVILHNKPDSNEYITCIPVVKNNNSVKIITNSGRAILVDSSYTTVIKVNKLGECIDSISEEEFKKVIDKISGNIEF